MKRTMILKLHDGFRKDGTSRATSPNKVVFTQHIENEGAFDSRLIESLYIDKRDVNAFGLTEATPRLRVTFEAVSGNIDK